MYRQVLSNIIGASVSKKIIVFESDDWGMIRTRSKKSLETLRGKGFLVDYCIYNRVDAVERNQDISGLLDVLTKYKEVDGKPSKFTLNNVVGNPDFNKIENDNYNKYYFKSFVDTLREYSDTDSVMKLYSQGLREGLIQMQFHGREHVNVNRWLEALQAGDKRFTDAFLERQFTVAGQGRTSGRKDYLDSFGRAYRYEVESETSVINSGLDLFESIWGFKSKSFIAPCYVWSPDIEETLKNRGVRYLQGTRVQRIPAPGLELKIKKKYHWQGKINRSGLISIVRNVMFEPAEHNSHPSVVDKAMKEIDSAFFWKKPAVVSSHRVNYIGRLDESNRTKNLKLLDELLKRITTKYPDVVFMSSDELGDLYAN